jgi:hypothetical protein
MKNIVLLLCLSVVFTTRAQQISLTAEDMPQVKDTLRLSLPTPSTTLQYKATGQNHTWDYSALRPAAQRVERFVSVSSTPLFYQLAFGALATNRATVASPVVVPENLRELVAGNLQNFKVQDIILFYRQTATDFQELGFGATINGVSAPVQYETPDVIYRFPMQYAQRDSSLSSLRVNYAAQSLYLAQYRKRVNHVDGWGSLTTPFGTFNVLRVVSTLYVQDTIRSGGTPEVRTQRPTVREYKWLGKNQGIPLLQITTAEVEGQEVILSVSYRDIYRNLGTLTSASPEMSATAMKAYPSPLGSSEALTLELPPLREPAQVSIFGPTGQLLHRQSIGPAAGGAVRIPASAFSPARGLYLLRIESGTSVVVKKILRD